MSKFLDRLTPAMDPPMKRIRELDEPNIQAGYGALLHRAGPELVSGLLNILRRFRDAQIQESVAGRVSSDLLILQGMDKSLEFVDEMIVKCVREYERREGIDQPAHEDSTVPQTAQERHSDLGFGNGTKQEG